MPNLLKLRASELVRGTWTCGPDPVLEKDPDFAESPHFRPTFQNRANLTYVLLFSRSRAEQSLPKG